MMLALPLQAFASASMLGCTFSHQAVQESMAMAGEAMAGCHESEPAQSPAPHDCKHCAACMLGSALPIPVVASVPALAVTPHHPVSAAAAFGGFVPDGPERPPRSPLA